MNKLQPLSANEIAIALTSLEGWTIVQGKLHRQFQFKSFVEAFGFMTSLARLPNRWDTIPNGLMSIIA